MKHPFLLVFGLYAIALTFALFRNAPRRKPDKPISRIDGKPLRLLIFGATGGTGRELVRQALALGHSVTAFVRDPAALKMEHADLRIEKGNVLDRPAVESAMRDHDAVVSALGQKQWYYPSQVLSRGTWNILEAMTARGVRRFVCESSLGVGNSAGRLGLFYTFFLVPLILPFVFADKVRQEKLIEESGIDWVIVRPGALNNSPARGQFRYGETAGSFLWSVRISRADVADFMLRQLTDDTNVGRAVGLAW